MKKFFVLSLALFILGAFSKVFATAQQPDYLIYNGTSLDIFTNPLESYFAKNPKYEKEVRLSNCTSCWRGYLSYWTIIDKKLFLTEISECCYFSQPRKYGDLGKIFGENYKDNKVFANWYSGELTIPKGKLIEYVHMGYGSIYEKELIIKIKNGVVESEEEFENKFYKIPNDFANITALTYSLYSPLDLLENYKYSNFSDTNSFKNNDYISLSDTNIFKNKDGCKELKIQATFNKNRIDNEKKIEKVNSIADSIVSSNKSLTLIKSEINKNKWGTYISLDAYENGTFKRYFIMVNKISSLILEYREKGNKEKCLENADNIVNSVHLLELGY